MKTLSGLITLSIFLSITPVRAEDVTAWSMDRMYPMTQLNAIYRTKQLNLPPRVPQIGAVGAYQTYSSGQMVGVQQSNFGAVLQFLTNAVWACSYSGCFRSLNYTSN